MHTFLSLEDFFTHFFNEDICKEYIANARWQNEIVCPHCKNSDKIYIMKKGYKCSKCRKPFSVTKDTIFENSPIPLQKWLAAIWMISFNKEGVSSVQLSNDLNITQKSAWLMLQRLRTAIKTKSFLEPNNVQLSEFEEMKSEPTTTNDEITFLENSSIEQNQEKKKFSDWLNKLQK